MKQCRTTAREFPTLFWSGLAASVALGVTFSSLLWDYRLDISPKLEHLSSIEFVTRDHTNSYWFLAEYRTPDNPPCYRDNTYLLYRDESNGERKYYVLATYPNGHGMVNVVPHFTLQFFLPIGFPPGEWKFVLRTHFMCPPFNLVSLHRESDPITIVVPADAGDIRKNGERGIRTLEMFGSRSIVPVGHGLLRKD